MISSKMNFIVAIHDITDGIKKYADGITMETPNYRATKKFSVIR